MGGKVVSSSQRQFPVNGQQLMMQLETMTSAMTDMTVTSYEEKMETGDQECLQQNQYLKHLEHHHQQLELQRQNPSLCTQVLK